MQPKQADGAAIGKWVVIGFLGLFGLGGFALYRLLSKPGDAAPSPVALSVRPALSLPPPLTTSPPPSTLPAAPTPSVLPVAAAEIVSYRLVDFRTATGQGRKMLLVDWKNTGTLPIYGVKADISALDYEAPNYTIFSSESRPILPGQTYREPYGEGHVLLPMEGTPNDARVSISDVKTSPPRY